MRGPWQRLRREGPCGLALAHPVSPLGQWLANKLTELRGRSPHFFLDGVVACVNPLHELPIGFRHARGWYFWRAAPRIAYLNAAVLRLKEDLPLSISVGHARFVENVIIHEAAHALQERLHGGRIGRHHGQEFVAACAMLARDFGFRPPLKAEEGDHPRSNLHSRRWPFYHRPELDAYRGFNPRAAVLPRPRWQRLSCVKASASPAPSVALRALCVRLSPCRLPLLTMSVIALHEVARRVAESRRSVLAWIARSHGIAADAFAACRNHHAIRLHLVTLLIERKYAAA